MPNSNYQLPENGQPFDSVIQQVRHLKQQMTSGQQGKLSSTAFQGHNEMQELVEIATKEFFAWNGLFTFQEPPAAKMENDVLDICNSLVSGGEQGRGNLTSGGTESNYCALHAMRAWARENKPQITQPEIVAPYSTHATVHKTAKYLDIKVVVVAQNDDLTVDIDAIESAVTRNTIGIVGSAPNWPYGLVDPIQAFGEIAIKNNLWLHVDACVGGYILPFMRELGEQIPDYDFSVPGVCSISADLHKYGYAPKPCSTVLWRSQEQQQYHYVPITEWACGLYMSQSFIGSRPLGSLAGIWALIHYWGRDGYLNNARALLDVKSKIIEQCQKTEGLKTWETHGPLLMIAAEDFDIQLLVGAMESKGWRLLGVNNPVAIHLTLDVMEEDSLQQFLNDLHTLTGAIRKGELNQMGNLSYGGLGNIEDAPKWLLSAVEIMEKQG